MSTALFVGEKGQGGAFAPSYPSEFKAQIAELERKAQERDLRRLERLEKAYYSEDLELCAMAAGEPVRLSCLKDNNARKGVYKVSNTTYYNRLAVCIKSNVQLLAYSLGKKYATAAELAVIQSGNIPEEIKMRMAVARRHLAEFTITIPHYKSETVEMARKRFCAVWRQFVKRALNERYKGLFGDYVRVFETHKDGVLHCHIILECKKSLLRRGYNDFIWRKRGGDYQVDGRSVSDWVRRVWNDFKSGALEPIGVGRRHSLQPVRKGVEAFAKYVSKYVSKDLAKRPLYLKGLRVVAFSADFLGGARLYPYDTDKDRKIYYYSKTADAVKWRYRRFVSWQIECAATIVRRAKLTRLCAALGISKDSLKRCPFWGFLTRAAVSSIGLGAHKNKWELCADVRNWLGDKFKTVMKFKGDNRLYDYADFLKEPLERRLETEFKPVGFIVSGVWQSLRAARIECRRRFLIKKEKLLNILKSYAYGRLSDLAEIRARLSKACLKHLDGLISKDELKAAWLRFDSEMRAATRGVIEWINSDPKNARKTAQKIPVQAELAF